MLWQSDNGYGYLAVYKDTEFVVIVHLHGLGGESVHEGTEGYVDLCGDCVQLFDAVEHLGMWCIYTL